MRSLGFGITANVVILEVNSVTTDTTPSNGTNINAVIDGKLATTIAERGNGNFTTLTEANASKLVSNSAYGFRGTTGGQVPH